MPAESDSMQGSARPNFFEIGWSTHRTFSDIVQWSL